MNKLGRLTKVDLRTEWRHEARELTPWLAQKENLAILCEELEIEVDKIRVEEFGGRFKVDIIAEETKTGRVVIIENQLEVTDHTHLGQLLTYAAGHDASIIVWVVPDYREEHQQAIEWFNRHMPESISFFLVKLELWTINGSERAPRFDVVARPNYWAKTLKQAGKGDVESETKLTQQQFWEAFKEFATTRGTKISVGQKAHPRHWYDIPIGTSRAHLSLMMNTTKERLGCEIYIPTDQELFARLFAQKERIQEQLNGMSLEWRELPHRTASRIITLTPGDPLDQSRWPTYFTWLLQTAERFQEVFKPLVK